MKTILTFGAGAVAPWVAAVVLQRLTMRRLPDRIDFLSRPPQPTR